MSILMKNRVAGLIFLSCIDKARTPTEINDIWGYSKSTKSLFDKEKREKLVKEDIITIEDGNKIKSNLEALKGINLDATSMRNMNQVRIDLIKNALNHMDYFIKILNIQEFQRKFITPENIKGYLIGGDLIKLTQKNSLNYLMGVITGILDWNFLLYLKKFAPKRNMQFVENNFIVTK